MYFGDPKMNKTLLALAMQMGSSAASGAVNALDSRESLSEFSAGTRLSPPCMMESLIERMSPQDSHSIKQALLNIYIGHYLTVVNRIVKVGNVSVSQILDPLSNPADANAFDLYGDTVADAAGAAAAAGIGGLMEGNDKFVLPGFADASNMDLMGDFKHLNTPDFSMESKGSLGEAVNLAVGKEIKVPLLAPNGKEVTVPVVCTLIPSVLNTENMVKTVEAFLSNNNSYISRYHAMRAGAFKSWLDYALGIDIAQQDLNIRINDTNGLYVVAQANRKRGLISTILSGKKKMNVASAMIVVTDTTGREIENALRKPLNNARARHEFFKLTGSMILCIVNQRRELVRIYQRGIADYGDYTMEEIRPLANSNPTSGFDINSVMRAYRAGEHVG